LYHPRHSPQSSFFRSSNPLICHVSRTIYSLKYIRSYKVVLRGCPDKLMLFYFHIFYIIIFLCVFVVYRRLPFCTMLMMNFGRTGMTFNFYSTNDPMSLISGCNFKASSVLYTTKLVCLIQHKNSRIIRF
jgi:hypothetical protein